MATFSDLLASLRAERFVGRDEELGRFRGWLASPDEPPVLAVTGPGGIGKSWLLDAFAGEAEAGGWPTRRLDASVPGSGSLLPGAGQRRRSDASTVGEGPRVLYLLDAVEHLGAQLSRLLADLANLEVGSRVVLAGRGPLSGGVWRRWEPLIRYLNVGPLDVETQRRYLDIRGVDDAGDRAQILLRAGGNPLALSLAVDLVVQAPAGDSGAPDRWRHAVMASVDELVADVGAAHRDGIDAAAVLEHFDQASLSALLRPDSGPSAFVRLCTSSAVRPVDGKVALHDDVRRAVIEDLRLHHPERLERLRRRAVRHYREAASAASGAERRRWSLERLHLLGRDRLGVSHLFEGDPDVTVGPGGPEDLPEMLDLLARASLPAGVPRVERQPELLVPLLADPDTAVQVARDAEGRLVGYGFYTAISERNRHLVAPTPAMDALLRATAAELGLVDGRFPEPSNVLFLSTVVTADADWAVTAAMSRQITDLFLAEGAYLLVPANPEYAAVTEGVGARRLPAEGMPTEDGAVLDGRLLDVSRSGFEGIIAGMLAGHPPRLIPLGEDLAAVAAAAVASLDDDEALAASSLAALVEADDAPIGERAQAVRELLGRAERAEGAWPTPELRLEAALDAVAGRASAGPGLRQDAARTSSGATDPPADRAKVSRRHSSRADTAPPAPEDGAGVSITMLGGFAVRRDGVEMAAPSGVGGALVKLVALRRTIPAEELMELLWPDVDPQLGRDRLRTVLARARRAIGAEVVVRRGEELALGPTVTTDVELFLAAAASARSGPPGPAKVAAIRTAVECYPGELLPGDRFAEWATGPRERLAREHMGLLETLADEAAGGGDLATALFSLERAIEADPFEEQHYLQAARLLLDAGRRGQALAVLQRASAAAASLGLPASPEIAELEQRVRPAS